jgi:Uncharacterised nucleotidyltransferase
MPHWRFDLTTLPSLPCVQRALVQATEYFAAELLHPSRQAPNWTGFEWSMARAAAVLHGVTPLLAGVLPWRGPEEWEGFVSQQRFHTALRQRRIEALLARIDAQARRAGLAIVPLKGAALYRLGLYSGGERPMADVDLLIAECDTERAKQLLQALGYLDTSVTWRHRVFEPAEHAVAMVRKAAVSFGEHADRPLKIDLHSRIAERLPLNTVDISAMIFPPAPHPGLNSYPSAAALFMHLLLHAAGNILARALRLIQLHDLALLAGRMRDAEWEQLLACRHDDRTLWWAVPPLELVARYYPQAIPGDVLGPLRAGCPRPLRRVSRRQTLSEISFARLRVDAFPGIAWSGSMSEKFGYVLGRVLPSRELLTIRETIRAEPWATGSSWSHLSQGRRILRWTVTRAPRPPAMHAVRCALEKPANDAAPPPPPADACRAAVRMP